METHGSVSYSDPMQPSEVWKKYFAGDHDAVLVAGANSAEIMHVTGLSLVALGRIDEGHTLLLSSTLARPNTLHFSNACIALLEAGRPELALTHAQAGLAEFEVDSALLFNAGNVMNAVGNERLAEEYFHRAFAIDPKNWEAAMNQANTLRRMGRLEEALEIYQRDVLPQANNLAGEIRATLNTGVTLSDLGRDAEALAVFDELASRAIIDSPEMDFNRATLRLKLGDYPEGWRLYQRRWQCPMAAVELATHKKPMLSSIEEGRGKHVLFCHEQGFGDSIQFVRYAPLLAAEGVRVTILCPEPLRRLFECLGLPVVTTRDLEYDFECPMLNAPMLFGTTLASIPGTEPYLTVPSEMITAAAFESWQKNNRLKVGLVWAGQSREAPEMKLIDNRRSIDYASFLPILQYDDIEIVSLQHGDREKEFLKAVPISLFPTRFLEPEFDFLDTAAVIMNLDMVISVDTAVAHLAAALGKPTWLLSRFDGCWRWLKDRDDSPWYPTIRIFNQTKRLHWEDVIARIDAELTAD